MSDSEGYDQENAQYGGYSEDGQFEEEVEGGGSGEEGPCGKIQGGICKCIMGFISLPLSLYMLGWNEKMAVCKSNTFIYAQENMENQYTGASCTSGGAKEGLAFLDCPVSKYENFTLGAMNDRMGNSDFGKAIIIPAAAVSQTVEMYQCEELVTTETRNKKQVKIYRYQPKWSSAPIPFSSFSESSVAYQARQRGCPGLANNPIWPPNLAEGTVYRTANYLEAGQFRISDTLLSSPDSHGFHPEEPVNLQLFANNFAKTAALPSQGSSILKNNVAVQGNYIVTCTTQVQVGCVRVSFQSASPTKITAVTNVGAGLETTPISIPSFWGCKAADWEAAVGTAGRDAQKKMTVNKFIDDLHSTNSTQTNLLRVLGMLMCWFSVYCCFGPLTAAADIFGDCLGCIPCIGDGLESIFEGMVECVLCLVSCTAGFACGMTVIAIVWVYMRPAWGIGLFIGAAVLICASFYFAKSQQKEKSGTKRIIDPEYYDNE